MNAENRKFAWRAFFFGALALALGLAFVPSAEAATLRLVKLRCYDTQDALPPNDECRLKLSGGWKTQWDRVMMAGDTWELANDHQMQGAVTVRLFDRDGNSDADLLGQVVIPSVPTNGFATALFDQNGALYKLLYRVVP